MRRDDAAQMRRCTGADDEQLDAPRWRLAHEPHHPCGRAVRGRDGHLARNIEFTKHVDGGLHHRRIRIRAHENQHRNVGHLQFPASAFLPMSRRYCMPSKLTRATPAYARSMADSNVEPRPTTVRTRPPAVRTSPPAWLAVP